MPTATPTATQVASQAASQASLQSRAAVRWYQLAVIVLGLALAAVTALAIYLAFNNSTATPGPVHPGSGTEQLCQPHVPC
jgi:hypothetical protein